MCEVVGARCLTISPQVPWIATRRGRSSRNGIAISPGANDPVVHLVAEALKEAVVFLSISVQVSRAATWCLRHLANRLDLLSWLVVLATVAHG